MHRRTQGNENLRVAQSLDNLAAMLSTEGQLVEAENLARQGLAIRSKLSGNPSVVVAISLNNLACILEKGGALAEAESKHREALAMRRKLYGNDNQFSTQSAGNLVQVLVRRGKLTEAETLAREYLAVCERLFPEDWKTSNFRSLLGSSLLGLQRHAEAEPLLLSGYAGMKQREDKVPNEGRRHIKETLQRLVQLYEQTNRPDQLAEWRKKLAQFDEVERVKQIPRPQP
jgi:tetratricopeptide (TPR) repeat protein